MALRKNAACKPPATLSICPFLIDPGQNAGRSFFFRSNKISDEDNYLIQEPYREVQVTSAKGMACTVQIRGYSICFMEPCKFPEELMVTSCFCSCLPLETAVRRSRNQLWQEYQSWLFAKPKLISFLGEAPRKESDACY